MRLMTNSHKSQSEELATGGGRETIAPDWWLRARQCRRERRGGREAAAGGGRRPRRTMTSGRSLRTKCSGKLRTKCSGKLRTKCSGKGQRGGGGGCAGGATVGRRVGGRARGGGGEKCSGRAQSQRGRVRARARPGVARGLMLQVNGCGALRASARSDRLQHRPHLGAQIVRNATAAARALRLLRRRRRGRALNGARWTQRPRQLPLPPRRERFEAPATAPRARPLPLAGA